MSAQAAAQALLASYASASAAAITGSNFLSSTVDASSYTFNDVSGLGAHTTVFTCTNNFGNGSPSTVTSQTVEGVSAAVKVSGNNGGNRSNEILAVNEATLAPDIVTNLSASGAQCFGIGVIGATGVNSLTPVATTTSTANPSALSINTTAGGLIIGSYGGGNGGTVSWNVAGELYDTVVNDGGNLFLFSGFAALTPTTQTPMTLTCTPTVNFSPTGVSASFR